MMNNGLTVRCKVHFKPVVHGRKQMTLGAKPAALAGRVPRISRLMALAIRFDELLRIEEVKDYAELARLGHVTRARVTQVMNLLNLAPDIQEELLFLPNTKKGRDPINETELRKHAGTALWTMQRTDWLLYRKANSTRRIPDCLPTMSTHGVAAPSLNLTPPKKSRNACQEKRNEDPSGD
jgi:hypothetical protein